MIEEYSLKLLCDKYGVSKENIVKPLIDSNETVENLLLEGKLKKASSVKKDKKNNDKNPSYKPFVGLEE